MLRSALMTLGWLAIPAAGASCAPAAAQCLLCAPADADAAAAPAVPLTIEIDASLDFPRATVGAEGGRMALDPAGQTRVTGDLTALGGLAVHGRVLVRGQPGRLVRVTLPDSVMLHTPTGGRAELARFQSDLAPAPRIGADGTLRFAFGGELAVGAGGEGDYRGRIPITVDYE